MIKPIVGFPPGNFAQPAREQGSFGLPRLQSLAEDTVTFGAGKSSVDTADAAADLKARIEAPLRLLYGEDQVGPLTQAIQSMVSQIQRTRPPELLREDFERPADWYKDEVVYMFYPERFGVNAAGKPNTFNKLLPMLDYLQALGVTTLYILPFLESPLIDAGFDVSDYRKVRKDLGGNAQFDRFMAEARKRGFKIKADLILNHVSDQHPWFQAALKGDPEKLDYFIQKDRIPRYEVRKTVRKGKVVSYQEEEGPRSNRRLIFPDIVKNHYRKEKVQGQNKYFYHTFYPHQPDLNWRNPKVLLESLDIMGSWANKGVDIFRLDALPFFVKTVGTDGENSPGTHAVVQILSACLQAMAPRSVIQAEACQWPRDILRYYGQDRQGQISVPGQGTKALKRTSEVQLAYHFPFMSSIWASLVTENAHPFWKAYKETPPIPESAAWATFLRVHDELTLEMVDPQTRQKVYNALAKKGAPFREGLGVSGRLADFLDHDPRRIHQIYSILFSIPGMPIIYYGDEIGELNNPAYMGQSAEKRRNQVGVNSNGVKTFIDTRDLARAPIRRERFLKAQARPETPAGRIYQSTKHLISLRKQEPALSKGALTRVPVDQSSVFAYLREYEGRRILVLNNLSDEAKSTNFRLPRFKRPASIPQGWLDLQTNKRVPISLPNRKYFQVSLEPYQSMWLVLD